MPLSDSAIRTAKPHEKPYKLTDGGGLFLLVTSSGGKCWRYSYRFNGKQKTLAIGTYPEIGLKDARDKHLEARKLLTQDIDPSEKRRAEKSKSENTFKAWAELWWNHWRVGKSPRHADYARRRLEADVFPSIGERPVTDIDAYDIVLTIKQIAARGALDMAKRAHQMIGQVFRYAIAHGRDSGCHGTPPPMSSPATF